MVYNCVAYRCNNLYDSRKQVSFHRFPFHRPDILKLWIAAVGRENWYPTKASRICGHHFLETDYHRPGGILKLLEPRAVPSVFSLPEESTNKIVEGETFNKTLDVPIKIEVKVEDVDLDTSSAKLDESQLSVPPSTSMSTQVKVLIDIGTQTSINSSMLSRRFKFLQRKIKTLKQKVRRRDLQITHMKNVISKITKSNHGHENDVDLIDERI